MDLGGMGSVGMGAFVGIRLFMGDHGCGHRRRPEVNDGQKREHNCGEAHEEKCAETITRVKTNFKRGAKSEETYRDIV